MGKLTSKESALIAEYVMAGKVNKVAMGAISGWDDLSFKEKKAVMFKNAKAQGKVRLQW